MKDLEAQQQEFITEYGSTNRLTSRQDLYQKYGTNSVTWFDFLYNRVMERSPASICDVGAGTGAIWQNRDLPRHLKIELVDSSAAMVEACRRTFGSNDRFSYQQGDANAEFSNVNFDCVLAAHVAYHLNDISGFIEKTVNKLPSHGELIITIPSPDHFDELYMMLKGFGVERSDAIKKTSSEITESLAALSSVFRIEKYENLLIVDNIYDIFQYAMSYHGIHNGIFDDEKKRNEFWNFLYKYIGGEGFKLWSRNLIYSFEKQ